MLEQNWPVFSRGRFAQDSAVRTQVVDFRCPLDIGGVWVEPGDLVFGDLDGWWSSPERWRTRCSKGPAKARKENVVRKVIEAGMSSTAALAKYRVPERMPVNLNLSDKTISSPAVWVPSRKPCSRRWRPPGQPWW
ncbi:MAG: hypothetical protein U1F77_04150 [Kiritimatiellia bacterium]